MLATFGLIVTLCAATPDSKHDECDSYVMDTFTSLQQCISELPNHTPALLRRSAVQGISCERMVEAE